MIPFYFFRKKVESPTSLVYFSGVMDSIDQWGLRDRRDIVRGSKTYANYYALDWALTVGLLALCLKAIEALIYVLLGMDWTIDYFDFFTPIILVTVCTWAGALHIIDCYLKALDLEGTE